VTTWPERRAEDRGRGQTVNTEGEEWRRAEGARTRDNDRGANHARTKGKDMEGEETRGADIGSEDESRRSDHRRKADG
jgi:hypothetical protein